MEDLSAFAGNGNIDDDPEFSDAANDDYRLDGTSGCANVGLNVAMHLDRADVDYDSDAFEPTPDLDWNCRQAGGPVDLGAYETVSDCNDNQIPDCEELSENDCDNNGIPDDCALNADTCNQIDDIDCDANAEIDECQICGADILFLIDTSSSQVSDFQHGDEVDDFCADVIDAVRTAATGVSGADVVVKVFKLGNSPLTCDDETTITIHEFLKVGTNPIAAPDPATGNDELLYTDVEEWGAATAILADNYPWRGNVRVIIPFSDEGPSAGDNLEFDDELSTNRVISQATANGVFVVPVMGHRDSQAVSIEHSTIYNRVALSTSGVEAVVLDNNDTDLDEYSEAGAVLASIVEVMVEDGLPCTEFAGCGACPQDCVGNCWGTVNLIDLLHLIENWGMDTACPAGIAEPYDEVDLFDLLSLLDNWGDCDDPSSVITPEERECYLEYYGVDQEAFEDCMEQAQQ